MSKEKVVLAYSGGLDTSVCVKWLQDEKNLDVVCVCGNVGQEETGLDARNAQGGYLFTYKRENPGEGDNYFVDVYRFVMDIDEKDLHLQEAETDGYMLSLIHI